MSSKFGCMKILVTGSNGQLGSELREIAKGMSYDFIFTDREKLDLISENLPQKVSHFDPDYIINCGAYTAVDQAEDDIDLCYQINDLAVDNLAHAALECNATLIHISTDYVYHNDKRGPLLEGDTCSPQSHYAKSKYQGELNLIKHPLQKFIILRTSWVYSSYGKNFVKTMLKLADSHSTLRVVNDQIGSPTYAADIADTIILMINKIENQEVDSPYGIFNYSNEGHISWADFARVILLKAGKNVEVQEISTKTFGAKAPRPNWSSLSKNKIKNVYDINTKGWTSSLDRCLSKMGVLT